jgi:hypothetical protein
MKKKKKPKVNFLFLLKLRKNSLLGIKDIAPSDAGEKIANLKKQLSQISELQEIRKEAVMKTFIDFQQMHNRMMICLEHLLEKGNQILVQDIRRVKDKIFENINSVGQEFIRTN